MISDEKNIEFANRILNHREELTNQEVTAWLERKENRELLDEIAGVKRTLQYRDYSSLKSGTWALIHKEVRKRSLFIRWWMGAVAMVICCIGIALWIWQQKDYRMSELENIPTVQIKPGSICAELILADGQSVALNNTQAKIETKQLAGILNDSVKGLDYTGVTVLDEKVKTEYNTLRVPVGGFYKLELPDGTKVWLNAASELKFPVQFQGGIREVFLKGEGYFQVARDTSRQFVVRLRNSQVSVLGTVFNINAYEDEGTVYTTLVEGSVAFYSETRKQQIVLKPGMQSTMEVKTGQMAVTEVETTVYTAWRDGQFIFRAMDLETIMRQLQRWYNFEVFYQNSGMKKYEFRGMISRDMEIRQVLDIIEEATDLKFEIQGKTVVVKR